MAQIQHVSAPDFLTCLFLSTASSFISYVVLTQIQAGHDWLQCHTLYQGILQIKSTLKYLEDTIPDLSVV